MSRGFSLVETLVAITLVACAITGLAQLVAMSARANRESRQRTLAIVLATEKMEQLRSASSTLEASGTDSLAGNVDGLCDFLDEYGRTLGSGTSAPVGTMYERRWSVQDISAAATAAWLLQVNVRPSTLGLSAGARLVSVSARDVD